MWGAAVFTNPSSAASISVTVAVASIGFALIQLDVTVVNVALPRIGAELGADVSALQWVVDAYALSFAVLLLSAGLLGDRLGARAVYLGGLAVFMAASLGCGLAPNLATLIAARVLQGIGAAAMLPNSLTLLNHACGHDATLRARAVGWWTAAGGISIAAGPIVGGALLGIGSWRTIFLINLPLCAAALAMTLRVAETPRGGAARGFDLPGQALAILALAGLIGGVIEARPLGVGHPFVILCLALAVVCAPLFVLVENRRAAPMLPMRLFGNRAFVTAILFGIVANFTYHGVVFVLSLYLQRVLGYPAALAGLAYLPLTATFILANVLSGWLVGRIGPRWPMAIGAVIDACGFALLLTLGARSSYWVMLPAFALMPAGMGLGIPATTIIVLSSVDKASAGIASATINAARQGAGALGVALFGALAGERSGDIVGGLHASAIVAVLLLVGVAALSLWGAGAPKRIPTERQGVAEDA
jgi:DHA2 family methylenomycin A resistance protein-like MFS transporter